MRLFDTVLGSIGFKPIGVCLFHDMTCGEYMGWRDENTTSDQSTIVPENATDSGLFGIADKGEASEIRWCGLCWLLGNCNGSCSSDTGCKQECREREKRLNSSSLHARYLCLE